DSGDQIGVQVGVGFRAETGAAIGVEGERLDDQVASENGSLETRMTRRPDTVDEKSSNGDAKQFPDGDGDRISYEVIFKWKAGLKEEIDTRLDLFLLSNGCRKSSDDNNDYYWEYAP
ncbi:hypothetical protein Tco_1151719, partial [Tanacetum coccineum]